MIEFRFDSIEISDGTKISLPSESIVLFVGPNNSGKSQALRDLRASQQYGVDNRGMVLVDVHASLSGSPEEATQWANDNLPRRTQDGQTSYLVPG